MTEAAPFDNLEHDFAHPSEAEFARVLDYYGVPWKYEPTTFPLVWDEAGNVVEAFTPDFYLPDQQLYVELTTTRQSLITKKHRKLRRLRELYPAVEIKLMNRNDVHMLFAKYGMPAPLGNGATLTGNDGSKDGSSKS
jgi:hypothetical protein